MRRVLIAVGESEPRVDAAERQGAGQGDVGAAFVVAVAGDDRDCAHRGEHQVFGDRIEALHAAAEEDRVGEGVHFTWQKIPE